MRSVSSIDITEYEPAGPVHRPIYLDSDIFYRPVDTPKSTELDDLADQAVESLMEDGYYEKEAVDYVGLRIHAAASFAVTAASQSELQRNVKDTPGGPPLMARGADFITPSEGLDVAPFLPLVAAYNFDQEKWLVTMTEIPENWEVTRPALRWLKLFDQQVSRQVIAHLLTRCVEIEGANGVDEIALYSSKISQTFGDTSESTAQLLDIVAPDQTLALFGELYPGMRYMRNLPVQIDPTKAQLIPEVRHVDHYSGGCGKMDWWHSISLFKSDPDEDESYGDVVAVSVNGQLVGSIEMLGEQSMLGLRDVRDAQSRLPLVAGGVYILRQEVVDRAKAASKLQGKWARIDLDKLEVRPLRLRNVIEPDDLEGINQTRADINTVYSELEARFSSQ